jgi:multidrug efflux system outer membrane protein
VFSAVLSLADVQSRALARAPAVVEARARVDEAQANVDAARGTGFPHAVADYNEVPQAGPIGGSVLQKLTTYGAQINLSELIGRDPAVAAAQHALRAAQESERDAERAERIKAIGLYVDVERTQAVRRLREAIVASARDDQRAAKLRYAAGDAPRLDVVRADVALASAQADLAAAVADESNAILALAVESGDPAVEVEPMPDALERLLPDGVADAALARALARRPEILIAQADVASEEAAVRGARAAALPAITAQAGYTTGVDTAANVGGPSANVTLDLPLSGTNAGRVHAEEARLAQARARLNAALQAVTLDVRAAFTTLAAQRGAVRATTQALREARDEVRAAEIGYREGASSSLDLADARRTYALAAVEDVTARAALYETIQTLRLIAGDVP